MGRAPAQRQHCRAWLVGRYAEGGHGPGARPVVLYSCPSATSCSRSNTAVHAGTHCRCSDIGVVADELHAGRLQYKLKPPLLAGPRPISAGVALLRSAALPLVRDTASGVIRGGDGGSVLLPAEVDLQAGLFRAVGARASAFGPAVPNVTVLSAGACTAECSAPCGYMF